MGRKLKPILSEGKVTSANIVAYLVDYDYGDLDEEATLRLFQYLVDEGMAWELEGRYGREATRLIEAGLITKGK